MRMVFAGTPAFAEHALAAVLDAGHDVVLVLTQPDRPAGRGMHSAASPVKQLALARGLALHQPATLKDPAAAGPIQAAQPDALVVAAYGLLLPQAVLDIAPLGAINIHASLLPRWRGAAPIQHAILAGDRQTGICIMRMDEGLDTGPVLLSGAVPIGPETTAETLHDALARLGSRLIVEALEGVSTGRLSPKPQPSDGATYAGKLAPDAGRIDWLRPADDLARMVRAFTPWPGVWFEHDGQRIKVLSAVAESPGVPADPGTVLDDRLLVACGVGALRIRRLQRPGKAAMDAEPCLRGFPILPGTRLG